MQDKKSQIKNNLIEKASSLGSTSKTAKGALAYILKNREDQPLYKRGSRLGGWRHARGQEQKERYFADRKADKEERHLNAQGKMSPRQIKARNVARDKNMTDRAAKALEESWPYRKAESSWAGGDHFVSVYIADTPSVDGGSERVWSSNGKWSGNNSFANLFATRRTFKYFPTLTTPDGLAVVDAKRISNREYQITWVEQSRGFDLKTVKGWLIKGYHVKASTLETARRKAAAARKRALAAEMAKRQQYREFSEIWVSFGDSIAAGNCEAASKEVKRQLCRKLGEIGGIRADELLLHRDDVYTRRAIAAAQNRK